MFYSFTKIMLTDALIDIYCPRLVSLPEYTPQGLVLVLATLI